MGQVDVFVVFLRFVDLVMSVLQTVSQVVMAGSMLSIARLFYVKARGSVAKQITE